MFREAGVKKKTKDERVKYAKTKNEGKEEIVLFHINSLII